MPKIISIVAEDELKQARAKIKTAWKCRYTWYKLDALERLLNRWFAGEETRQLREAAMSKTFSIK